MKKRFDRRIIKIGTAALLSAVIMSTLAMNVQAAGEGTISLNQDVVRLGLGAATTLSINYQDVVGGFADLAVVSADTSIAVPTIADTNPTANTASLGIVTTGVGTTVIAVYRISNPAVVDYVSVQSGLTSGSDIVTVVSGDSLITTYNDRMVYYNAVLSGKNEAQLAVSGMIVERESGLDYLKVTGTLLAKDSKIPGMNTFYANFYGTTGELIKRQAVYSRDPLYNEVMELRWSIPEGCSKIVIE